MTSPEPGTVHTHDSMWIHQTTYKEDADEFRDKMERESPTFIMHYKTDYEGTPVWRIHSPNYPCDWCPEGGL